MADLPHIPPPLPRAQAEHGADALRRRLRIRAEEARNILVVVRAYSEALERRYDDHAFRTEMRDVMRESTERLMAALDEIEQLHE
jgi:hypothetical protein